MFLDEIPDFRRHVAALVRDLPVVQHAAELFARTVDEGLLFFGQLRGRERHQAIPVGHAGEELPVPPDISGLQCLPLGIGHRRQQRAVNVQRRTGNAFATEFEQVGNDQQSIQQDQQQHPQWVPVAEEQVGEENATHCHRGRQQADPVVCEVDGAADEQQEPE